MTHDLDTVNEASPPIDGAQFEVNVRDLDGTRFVSVSGEVDLSVADTLAEVLCGQRVLVNMTGLLSSTQPGLVLFCGPGSVGDLDHAEECLSEQAARIGRLLPPVPGARGRGKQNPWSGVAGGSYRSGWRPSCRESGEDANAARSD
jgi:hypothetical protein